MILLAVAGPDYECLYADIGSNGRMNDSGVWTNYDLRQKIENKELSIPAATPLPYGDVNMPYVFVGDCAFALKSYMMKPYPQRDLSEDKRVYNCRHNRASRISENLFGILANRWRVFRGVLNLAPEKAMSVTMCALVLHNFLRKNNSRHIYSPPGLTDRENENGNIINGEWRAEHPPAAFQSLEQLCGNNPTRSAKLVRDMFKDHFMNEWSVEWQWERV